jgi:hypothetical protein
LLDVLLFYAFSRVEIQNITLPKFKEEYYSDSLFQNCELPCKIVICFVETKNKNGTYDTNPVQLFDIILIFYLNFDYKRRVFKKNIYFI